MPLLSTWPAFSCFLSYPQANWALLVLIPRWVVLCIFYDPVGLSNKLSFEARSFSYCFNPHRFFQSEVLRLYCPALEPWVTLFVLLPSCSSWFIHMQMWGHPVYQPPPHLICHLLPRPPGPPAAALLHVLSAPAACLYPSYRSG